MENLFIKNFILQGILEDLEKETKKTINGCRTQQNLKGKKEKATSEELLQKSENIIKIMIKQKIKHISRKNKKAIDNNNINDISKIENNNNTIMLYLKLMEKEKAEDKQAKTSKYKQNYISSKKALLNYIKKIYHLSDYLLKKNYKNTMQLFFETLKAKTIHGNGNKNTIKNAYYKSLKPIYNHITKQVKKGYNVNYKEDFNDLQQQAIIHLLEYNKKYNKNIVLNSKSIFYKVMNKIEWIYQKNNIVNCLTYSLDKQLENSNTTYYNCIKNSNVIDVTEKDFTNSLTFENMNSKEKSIYILKLKGLTFEEIAEKIDMNINSVKTIFYRLKAKA